MNDKKEILFSETQHFSKWIFILVIAIAVFAIIFNSSISNETFEGSLSKGDGITVIILSFFLPISITALIFLMKLQTTVKPDCIYIRFFPLRTKKISFDQIEQCYARKYKPILEYGGWGIRGSFSKGKAYNARGNKGVQLVLKNSKKILIGSQKHAQLAETINAAIKNLPTKPIQQ
ncbi:MAG: hypothetical protein KAS96_02210 [Planctomycetes bacterium]|nr:hypothetical protein [Planctomycetota bacterium]